MKKINLSNGWEVEVLKQQEDIVLVHNHAAKVEPYIVGVHLQEQDDGNYSWGWGRYYNDLESAEKKFNELCQSFLSKSEDQEEDFERQ